MQGESEENFEKVRYWIGNIIHIIIFLIFVNMAFKASIDVHLFTVIKWEILEGKVGINEIFTFIGALAFILFGITGVYEYLYSNGMEILVPPCYKKNKKRNALKQAEYMMEVYYQKDIDFIQEYEEQRMNYLVQSLGVNEKQFYHLNYHMLRARITSERSVFDVRQKAKKALLDKCFIVNQAEISIPNRVYQNVDYFINMYTALYDVAICKTVVELMVRYLEASLRENIELIDYLIIPRGSNLLLGLEIGKILRKPVIAILHEERIYKNVYWDGNYKCKEGEVNNIVIIHDVLVTGKRIYESIDLLPRDTYSVMGVFNLFQYNHKEYNGVAKLCEHNIPRNKIYSLLEIDEKLLKDIYDGKYEKDV